MDPQRNIPLRPIERAKGRYHQQPQVKGGGREVYWPGTLMALGIFVALGSLYTVAPWTLIAPDHLFRGLLLFCFVGNLWPAGAGGLRWGMERLEWFLFNLLAVGPLLTSLLLWLNFTGHGPVTTTEHGVAEVEASGTTLYYRFTDDFLADHPFARATYRDWYPIVGDRMRVSTADGLFGVPVVVLKEPFVSAP